MSGQAIAQYFAKVKLLVEPTSIKNVDDFLKKIEKSLGKVSTATAKEVKAKKDSTAATEQKVKSVEKETKATKDLNKEQEKQSKDIARRIKQQQALLKKADADAVRQANTFAALQKRLANSNPVLKSLSQKQIAANRSAFLSGARAPDIRTGQGLQYRLGAQLDNKIRQLQAAQKAFLASRVKQSGGSFDKDVFDQLQLRLASKLRAPRQSLSENQVNRNRAAFFKTAKALETRTGQGVQYRLGEQAAKIQQETQRQQEQAAISNQRQARRVSDAVDKGLKDLEREIQRAFSPVQNAAARRNARLVGQRDTIPPTPRSGGSGGGSGGNSGGDGGGRSSASFSRANFLHAGGAGGALARYGLASLPFVGGVYGLSSLNTANQELISGQLTTQAVLVAKGYSTQQGVDANKWLFGLANDVGFNYMDALPDYNQFLSNSLGAGLGVEQSQDIFKGFSEYQTAMGVTPARRKLVQNALSQMLG